FLKSYITIYLENGATLLANPDRNEYPVLPASVGGNNLGTWQGEEAECFASIITAFKCENISIIGEGTIDCNALAGDWYTNHRIKRIAWRPRGLFFNRCKNILVQGISVKDTPSWNVHPYFCKNVKLFDLTLKNIPSMPTTDGIDPDCCDGVEIIGVKISVGDDCIAIKSGTLELAKKYKIPSRNILIRNCLMCEGHGGVVFGSELSGGIENVTVTKCVFDGTDRGLRIKTRRGRGRIGKCGGVTFSDIEMINVKVPFVINMYYNMGDETGHTEYVYTTKKLPIDDRTPKVGSFTFKNMTCSGVEYSAGAFYGLPEAPIKNIKFEDVEFSYNKNSEAGFPDMREENEAVKNQGLDFRFVEEVTLKNVTITGQDGEEVLLEEVGKFNKT
ncbi:MAG: glycoside hydrolase family 28 protein, partial [Clostridia bacterium]|nr:glycoside hydrolase family 28 protein [Clostridia bacterium]